MQYNRFAPLPVALNQYGCRKDAKVLADKLLSHVEGLTDDRPICENYHPETGAMLGATNFGWSAAHWYLMYREGYWGHP